MAFVYILKVVSRFFVISITTRLNKSFVIIYHFPPNFIPKLPVIPKFNLFARNYAPNIPQNLICFEVLKFFFK